MAATAAQMFAYLYPEEEDPESAFSWWLSPCGGTDLVPDDIKKIFQILSGIPDGVSSYKKPKNLKQGSGKKGDDGNPTDQSTPRSGRGGVTKTSRTKKCPVPAAQSTMRLGEYSNTLRLQSCVGKVRHTEELVITSLTYHSRAQSTEIRTACPQAAGQACYHYSSAVSQNTKWSTLSCPPAAATAGRDREEGRAVRAWNSQHKGAGWALPNVPKGCERDEFPPAYLLTRTDDEYIYGGENEKGQLIRVLPATENSAGGRLWKGVCFKPLTGALSDIAFRKQVNAALNPVRSNPKPNSRRTQVGITVDKRPFLVIDEWFQNQNPLPNNGLNANPCWPSAIAAADPGFNLLTVDPYYGKPPQNPPYDYSQPYVKGSNGS